MNNFTNLIYEVRSSYGSSLTSDELRSFIDKTSKTVPSIVKKALYYISKYNILNVSDINKIISGSKNEIDLISTAYNASPKDIQELHDLLKDMKGNVKLLPHFLTPHEREAFIKGKLRVSDLTIDLNSAPGRNEVVKMYMPLVYKIVNQYVGKSRLTKQDLISAGLEGFSKAMKDWDKSKGSTFKSYLSYRIQQQILNDMDAHGHSLSGTNSYATKKYGAAVLDAVSMDSSLKAMDKINSYGEEDKWMPADESEMVQWKRLFNILEMKFKQRDIDIFYRYFGLNGYKREKSKDIAKSYGMSEGNIRNSIINKIIAFLKSDKQAMDILTNLQDAYNESLMVDLMGCDKEVIYETLYNDDMFILLEELNKWTNPEVFKRCLDNALENMNKKDIDIILDIISGDFEKLDSSLKKYKKLIILFLQNMYPAEGFTNKTDVTLLEYMTDIQNTYKRIK